MRRSWLEQVACAMRRALASSLLAWSALPTPGAGPADDPTCAESDMDGDGIVGGPDFNLFRLEFASAPGPGSPSCL